MKGRTLLENAYRAAIRRVDPELMLHDQLRVAGNQLVATSADGSQTRIDLRAYDRVRVLGVGKAAASMARGVEQVLGDRVAGGVVVTKQGHVAPLDRVELLEASHPVPDETCVSAAERLLAECGAADERTLVISVISGGGSALLAAPLQAGGLRVSLEDQREITAALLASGATIHELNCVRKHLSAVKGGRLAAALAPATSLNLILSDVVGDRLDTIASGLTVPDTTTFGDALAILDRHATEERRFPPAALALLQAGARGEVDESPDAHHPSFARVHNVLVGSGLAAAGAAVDAIRAAGVAPLLLATQLSGEAREVARVLYAMGRDISDRGIPAAAPVCLVCGGETTVTVRGDGTGGRCQEMALAYLVEALTDDAPPTHTLLAAGTDGNDGPTDAAGAFVDSRVVDAARRSGGLAAAHRALERNDSYAYLRSLDALFKPGPTNTNVADLYLLLAGT